MTDKNMKTELSSKNSSKTPILKKQYTGFDIVLMIIGIIILYILAKIIQIKQQYKPIFDWWKNYGGNDYQFVNMFNIMAAYNSNIMYHLSKITGSAIEESINLSQIMFLVENIFPYSMTIQGGIQTGYILPKHVANSVKFAPNDNLVFDKWYKSNNKDITVPLQFDSNGNEKNNGVYPETGDTANWEMLFTKWGVNWGKNKNNVTVPVTGSNPGLDQDTVKEWTNYEQHPDNFLGVVGIMPDSPLVISFVNDDYADPVTGLKMDAQSLKNLLGSDISDTNPGGWIGYLFGMGYDISKDEYDNFIYSSWASPAPSPPCSKGAGSASSAWGGALASGAGIAAMAFMFTNPIGIGVLLVAGAAITSLQMYGYYSKKC
jgi:hypothetical protein